MIRRRASSFAIVIAASAIYAHANELFVPGQYGTIQDAIDAAYAGDHVVVAPGTYIGAGNREVDFRGKRITVRSVEPQSAATVAGTIMDCQRLGRGFVLINGETTDSVIDGLTILHADNGGVSVNYASAVTVRRSVISQCVNGAIRVGAQCSLVMDECRVVGNSGAQFIAGGINCAYLVTVRLTNTLVADNTDGGLNLSISDVEMTDCVIRNNTNERTLRPIAGGLEFDQGFNPAAIRRCRFENNHSAVRGGGMHLYTVNVPVLIESCVFVGNTAGQAGAAVSASASYDGTFLFQSCTIVDNVAPQAAGVFVVAVQGQNRTTLNSCIVWGNREGKQIDGVATAAYCDVEGGFIGTGNLDVEPQFVDAAAGDYHLASGSPCIEAGDAAVTPGDGQTDIDGDARRMGARVDQGADEYRFTRGDLNCDGNVDFFDIDAFLAALFDPSGYAAAYPACDIANADLNGDAAVDFFDIDPFLVCLFGACP